MKKFVLLVLCFVLAFVLAFGSCCVVNAAEDSIKYKFIVTDYMGPNSGIDDIREGELILVVGEDPYLDISDKYGYRESADIIECSDTNVVMFKNGMIFAISPGEATLQIAYGGEIIHCQVKVIVDPEEPDAYIKDFANADPTDVIITSYRYTPGRWVYDETDTIKKYATEKLYVAGIIDYSSYKPARFKCYYDVAKWESSNENVVKIFDGQLHAKDYGKAEIIAKSANGEILARKVISVAGEAKVTTEETQQVSYIDIMADDPKEFQFSKEPEPSKHQEQVTTEETQQVSYIDIMADDPKEFQFSKEPEPSKHQEQVTTEETQQVSYIDIMVDDPKEFQFSKEPESSKHQEHFSKEPETGDYMAIFVAIAVVLVLIAVAAVVVAAKNKKK